MTPDQKQRESQRVERQRKKRVGQITDQEKEDYRRAQRERKRKSREKKAAQNTSTPRGFQSPQALGKAVKKLVVNLPPSPGKRKMAIHGLASHVGVKLVEKAEGQMSAKQIEKDETFKIVQDFYFHTDVVWTAPGLNDEITVWQNGKRERLRKYYLVMYLKEVFRLFQDTHPDVNIKFSKFASLRPKNVLLLKSQPEDACKCKIHENFTHKLKGLHTEYNMDFWDNVLCENKSKDLLGECWKNECEACKNGKLFFEKLELSESDDVYFKEWVKNDNGRLVLDVKSVPKEELCEMVANDWDKFIKHVRVKRVQSDAFHADKDSCSSSVLQFDFAMAYSCQYQDEVQSALWTRASVNLFTAALYLNGNPCKSFLIVTDYQEKNKDAVYVFVTKFIDKIGIQTFQNSQYLALYSDGPASEFKNRFAVKLLQDLKKKIGIETRWQYFATSHGKGVVDGIGGAAKSAVRRLVMSKSGKVVVQCAADFHKVVSNHLPNITSIYMTKEDVQANSPDWSNVSEVLGISKIHTMVCKDVSTELFETDADFAAGNVKLSLQYANPRQDININDWVVVTYNNVNYPGEVTGFQDQAVEVSVMVSSNRSTWHWPKQPDILLYQYSKVVAKIAPPVPTGSRGLFKFSSEFL